MRYKTMLEQKTGKTWYVHFTQEFGNWSAQRQGARDPVDLSVRVDRPRHDDAVERPERRRRDRPGRRSSSTGALINLVVSHLDPSSQTMRLTQAKETIAWALTFAENRIVTGDMNAWPDQSSIAEYNKTYNDSWAVAESKGLAIQFAGLTPVGRHEEGADRLHLLLEDGVESRRSSSRRSTTRAMRAASCRPITARP